MGRKHRICFGACLSLLVSRTSTGDGCVFLLEPRASDLKPIKNKNKNLLDLLRRLDREEMQDEWNESASGLVTMACFLLGGLVGGDSVVCGWYWIEQARTMYHLPQEIDEGGSNGANTKTHRESTAG